jgi:CRP-like cAMP-binding protein
MPSTLLMLDLADFRTFTANHPDLKRAIDAEAQRRMTQNQEARDRPRFGGGSSG